ncbi:Receptor-like serine/threonine-protein kinase ALE2 [Bienertia sinuspersici]
MVSSPPSQLSPPMVSSPSPQLNPPNVSSPPPQPNPPNVSSPPPQLNPPNVSSPPPQSNPPIVSSPPPQLNPPIASSPPFNLTHQILFSSTSTKPTNGFVSSTSTKPTNGIFSSTQVEAISCTPPQLNPPIVSSPPQQLIPPIESSPPPQLVPLPASPPNSEEPSNASVPSPFIVSPPDSSSPRLAVPPHASVITSPPLTSHASPPLPRLAPPHVSPPPSPLPLISPPRSSIVPRSVAPHISPTPLAPNSPANPSHPSYAPPPSEPSDSSPEATPPAHQVTPRSHPPSSDHIEAPKHSPFLRSNGSSEPDISPFPTPPPSNSPISGRISIKGTSSSLQAPSEPKVERHHATAPSPFSFRVSPTNGSHHSLRHSPVKGSPAAMTPLSSPPDIPEITSAPSPLPKAPPGQSETPFLSPKISPSGSSTRNTKRPRAPPSRSLPPPPPNADCAYLTCTEPYTNTPPGSPCGCVWPMQVGLRLSVPLYTFFPLVSELSREIAAGVFMKQSQVRVMGANAASEQSEKTIALVDLVPLAEKFDNVTSELTFQRFWHKQVVINKSIFGDYDVLYVRYPGLPPSPPMAPADMAVINGMPYSVQDPNQSNGHPLGVDVTKQRHKNKLSGIAIVAIVFSAIVGVLICCSVAWVLVFRHRNRDLQPGETPRALPSLARSSGPTGNSTGSGPGSSLSVESSLATYAGSAKTFSTSEIEKATDNLSPSRVIGEGGFGLVYGGVLEDETSVAVKVLKRDDQQGGREFLAEVEMLSRLHHRNLVKLIGICTDERLRCLVYELIPNGSVDSHLHGTDKEIAPLDWASRLKIALGAARGLAYLHEDSSPRVIHRDFKSSNILLESDFTAKVSDFGLARSAMDGESRHISTRVMGTFGYVAPEYAMTGHLLVKSDVYSYGVVLLELLTGRKPVDMSQPPGQENLVAWTRPFLTTKEGLEMILDPSLGSDVPLDSVAKVAAIASMCVQPEVSHRPFMGEVVQALKLVCNECDDSKDGDSSTGSPESLSVDFEAKASPVSETRDYYLPAQVSIQKYLPTHDVEKGMTVSENFTTSAHVDRQTSDSFRRHSASGPLKTVKGQHFWQRIGRQPNGKSVSEHGIMYRLWAGSH